MKYNELKTSRYKQAKRVGRGIGSGTGKTAGRGTKGQNSRSGGRVKPGFEGGQNPLMQRLPKLRGFNSPKTKKITVTLDSISNIKGKITNNVLFELKLIKNYTDAVKVVSGKNDLNSKLDIELQAISANALKQVEKQGGAFKKVSKNTKKKTTKTTVK